MADRGRTSTNRSTSTSDLVAELYEPRVEQARSSFRSSEGFLAVTSPDADPATLDRFLINFCALGVQMTEPVDRWIRRAGKRCEEVGLAELGAALQRHAEHEARHHEMMIADTHTLVGMWNQRHPKEPLDADALIARLATPGVQDYVQTHEDTIAGSTPYGQLAIEYEIELLSITAGPELLGNVATVCGADRIGALSFLTDHIAVDEGHTVFNRRQLNALLAHHPEFAGPLAEAGSSALRAYAGFLADCHTAAAV